MTRRTNARIAGFTYLFYIAVAFPEMVLFDRATSGEGIAAKLGNIGQHATDVRGRMVPVSLAWLGVVGSAWLVVGLPLQVAGFLRGPVTQLMWLPVAVFELVVAVWLLIKGVATPAAVGEAAAG